MFVSGEDTYSLQEVIEKHGQFIRTTIGFLLRNPIDLEDRVQDYYVSLLRRPIPKKVDEMNRYLYRSMAHHTVSWTRQNQRKERLAHNYNTTSAPPDKDPHPTKTSETQEQYAHMLDLIKQQLPKQQSRALLYRYKFHLDNDTAAQAMGIPRKTFLRYISLGLKKLRKVMKSD